MRLARDRYMKSWHRTFSAPLRLLVRARFTLKRVEACVARDLRLWVDMGDFGFRQNVSSNYENGRRPILPASILCRRPLAEYKALALPTFFIMA